MGIDWAILNGVIMMVLPVDVKPALRPKDEEVLSTEPYLKFNYRTPMRYSMSLRAALV